MHCLYAEDIKILPGEKMSNYTCLECGNIVDDISKSCGNCGQNPNIVKIANQKYFAMELSLHI